MNSFDDIPHDAQLQALLDGVDLFGGVLGGHEIGLQLVYRGWQTPGTLALPMPDPRSTALDRFARAEFVTK